MPEADLVKTGVAGLDAILSEGIPRGNVILLEGAIGTGKTTLGAEFVYRGARMFNEPGIIVLFEVSPHKLVRDAARFGWDLPALEREHKLRILFTNRQAFWQELRKADSLFLEEAAKIDARRLFVDGVAGDGGDGVEPRDAFHVLVAGLQRENLTTVLAVEASVLEGDKASGAPEESIADTVIRLRTEDVSRATVRSIEIVKSRGHDFQMGRHSFRIVDGQASRSTAGCRPLAWRAATRPPPSIRRRASPTGIPGLDAVVNGGYFLGSTTVVAGISGVGKSVMALQYIAEGARRGERSLMLSLDEQVPQVLRNALTIGIDLQPQSISGSFGCNTTRRRKSRLISIFTASSGSWRSSSPKRVVIDSLSTYGSNMGTRGRVFRDFFHALVALMKEHQTAAVYNHENPEMLGMSSMMGDFAMSSLVDNILLMNWIEPGDAFRLGLTVAKMRANPSTRSTHECEILDGQGLRVLPRHLPVGVARLPLSGYQGLISRSPTRHPAPGTPSGHDDNE